MLISLSDESRRQLLALPETGPGFQLVSAIDHGQRRPFLVLNADHALPMVDLPNYSGLAAAALMGRWINDALDSAMRLVMAPQLRDFELLATRVEDQASLNAPPISLAASLSPPSSLVKTTRITGTRRFHRFSPFNPDRRVHPVTGDFAPGTYACPESEVPFVPTGFAAVGRFALPSSQPASYHYVIEAGAGTHVLFGTVAPAFGQAGGGVEALLPAGAVNVASPPIRPSTIPDE
jgi:hypothetical protein